MGHYAADTFTSDPEKPPIPRQSWGVCPVVAVFHILCFLLHTHDPGRAKSYGAFGLIFRPAGACRGTTKFLARPIDAIARMVR